MDCENCGCEVPDATVWQKYCRPCSIAVAAEKKRQRNREAQLAKNAATKALFSDAQQALDDLIVEYTPAPHEAAERKPDARFFKPTLAATPENPAGMRDRDYQLTGAAAACNHGAGVGMISVAV